MALPNPLIKAVPLSRPTKLAAAIDSVATTLYVEDDDAGRDQDGTLIAPIVLTIGTGAGAEEVYCPTAPTDRHYETVTRGSGGTTARSWPKGTPVARRISTTEWDWLVENVADLDERPGVGSEGNVVGPATSTASALARFDDTTGILLKDSAVTVTDAGTVNIPTGQTYNINGVPHTHGIPKLDDLADADDTTDLDATTEHHGLAPRLPGDPTLFLRGDGTYSVPLGDGSGYTVRSGDTDPTTEGNIGDWFINTTDHAIFGPKTVEGWGTGVSLVGPTGADGADGADGLSVLSGSGAPASELGVDGDWYIDSATHGIYGPKTSGSWGSPTSLIGPQGETGATGPAGADGDDGVGHDAVSALISRAGGWTHPTVSQGTAFSADVFTATARARYRYKEALARRDRMTSELAAWAIPARLDLISGTEGTDWFDATDNAYHEIVASAGSQSATLTSLIEDLPENAVLFIPAGSYRFDTTVDLSKPIILVGEAGTIIDCSNATADADLFTVNVGGSAAAKMSGVELFGLEFVGPGYDTDPRLMRAFYLQGFRVQYCYFHGFGQSVIRLHECDDTLIEYNRFDNNSYDGVGYSVSVEDRSDRTTVRHNWFTTRGRHFITTTTGLGSYTPADFVGEILVEDNYFHYHIDNRLDTGAAAVDTHDNCNGPVVVRRNVFENVNKMVQLRSCTRGAVVVDNVGINCYLGIYTTNEDLSTTPWHSKVDRIADNFLDIDGDYALVVDQGNADISRNIIRCGYAYYHADLGTHTADYLKLTDTIWGWGEYASDPGELLKPGSDATETGSVQLIEAEMSEPDEIDPFTSSGGAAVDSWLDAGAFTRASDATFTVTDNATNQAIFVAGRPIRYRATAGTWRCGIVTGYASGTVTLAGHALTTSDDDEMAYGDMARVVQVPVLIPGFYEDATETALIAADLGSQLTWGQGTAYLVRVRARSRVHDTGTDGSVNVSVNGQNVLSTALTIAADATWVSSTTGIAASYYDAQFDEVIEVVATKNGNGDAQDLAVQMTFVVA